MENIIAKLLEDFEQGKMSRRQLIQSLAVTAAAASAVNIAPEAKAASATPIKITNLNHTAYYVRDYRKTRDWYSNLFGMTVLEEHADKESPEAGMCRLTFGDNMIVVRSGKNVGQTPRIDHVGYLVADWNYDAMAAELKNRNIPNARPEIKSSLHVLDPDGFLVQFGGIKQY